MTVRGRTVMLSSGMMDCGGRVDNGVGRLLARWLGEREASDKKINCEQSVR
jgi:hypothetical protein